MLQGSWYRKLTRSFIYIFFFKHFQVLSFCRLNERVSKEMKTFYWWWDDVESEGLLWFKRGKLEVVVVNEWWGMYVCEGGKHKKMMNEQNVRLKGRERTKIRFKMSCLSINKPYTFIYCTVEMANRKNKQNTRIRIHIQSYTQREREHCYKACLLIKHTHIHTHTTHKYLQIRTEQKEKQKQIARNQIKSVSRSK